MNMALAELPEIIDLDLRSLRTSFTGTGGGRSVALDDFGLGLAIILVGGHGASPVRSTSAVTPLG